MKKRVLVAMSGGVDSSVAAGLLVEQGYDVVGVTMQVWDYSVCNTNEGVGTCCSTTDVDDARQVANHLGIPFYVINCEEPFRTFVVDPFIKSYLQGQTPSPCVNCNTFLKFNLLIRKMEELDCSYLATGHYAKISLNERNEYAIYRSGDDEKDQTYFLFTTERAILPKILFPLGDLKKEEVRKIAERMGLVNSKKKDSVGICFVGDKGYARFIEDEVSRNLLEPGVVRLYPSGRVLGEHSGVHNFTYGQRKGLGLSHSEPLYVLKIDPQTRNVWVGPEGYLYKQELELQNPKWINPVTPGETVTTKIRFHHKGAPSRLFYDRETERVRICFDEPQRAITPGQVAVCYRGEELLGGGWIT